MTETDADELKKTKEGHSQCTSLQHMQDLYTSKEIVLVTRNLVTHVVKEKPYQLAMAHLQ